MKDYEDRIEKIETDMSYLQDMVQQLNAIVTSQQVLVSKLEKQNEFLARRVEELDTEARPNRKPPHY
ncbi:MAG: SlyX family protein [Sphaerochaetaceae bacterium]|nr:SlyX family protein [Sphaerochaetaceae bacterium]